MDKQANRSSYTYIGEGTEIIGELKTPHQLRIDGTIKGKVLSTSEMLTVGSNGIVEITGDITAKSAMIGGSVRGNVTVEDRVELESRAKLIGNLKARELVINEGAVFQGNCVMDVSVATKV